MFFVFSLGVCSSELESYTYIGAVFILLCPYRKMTFGKVNELGQFIRESEPEPDAKKSKGAVVLSHSLTQIICFHCIIFNLFAVKTSMNLNCIH